MVKKLANKLLTYLLQEKNKKVYKSLAIALEAKHVAHLITLANRTELLKKLPKNAIVAEIGVDKGDFSELILAHAQPQKLHLIDAWHSERYGETLKLRVSKKFEKEIQENKIEINRGLSTEVLTNFPNAYFDWVYIDTDHTYYTTASELKLAKAKVKKGGIISGHDYVIGYWDNGVRYGVIEAVHEFCVQNNWEIIYLTAETNSHLSFALKEIE